MDADDNETKMPPSIEINSARAEANALTLQKGNVRLQGMQNFGAPVAHISTDTGTCDSTGLFINVSVAHRPVGASCFFFALLCSLLLPALQALKNV